MGAFNVLQNKKDELYSSFSEGVSERKDRTAHDVPTVGVTITISLFIKIAISHLMSRYLSINQHMTKMTHDEVLKRLSD